MSIISVARSISAAFVFLSILFLAPAFALSLDEAKASGVVGERMNGYLGAVATNPSPEVTALVNDINQKRKQAYEEIAKKNGTELVAVEKLAAEKAIEKTAPGHFINLNGAWVKK